MIWGITASESVTIKGCTEGTHPFIDIALLQPNWAKWDSTGISKRYRKNLRGIRGGAPLEAAMGMDEAGTNFYKMQRLAERYLGDLGHLGVVHPS